DFRIRRHFGFELATRIVDRDTDLKGGHVVLLDAHGRNLGYLAIEGLVLERLNLDPRRLSQVDLPDIALIDFAFYIDLAGITQGHDQRGARAEDENRTDCVSNFHIARKHDAINRRLNVGVAELFFKLFEVGAIAYHLRLRLGQFGS